VPLTMTQPVRPHSLPNLSLPRRSGGKRPTCRKTLRLVSQTGTARRCLSLSQAVAEAAKPARRKKVKGPLSDAVVLVAMKDDELERAAVASLEALGAKVRFPPFRQSHPHRAPLQVLKRLGKSLTHCVFGAGGPYNVIAGSLGRVPLCAAILLKQSAGLLTDVGAKLVGPAWVAACQTQSRYARVGVGVVKLSAESGEQLGGRTRLLVERERGAGGCS
jgi:hypothetical protein